MHSETAFVLTILVLCYAAVSGLVRRWYLAPALIFVVVGMVLGPSCLGLIEAGSVTKGFTVLAELALTVILFNQASTLDLRTVLRRGHLPLRLMAIGIPLSIGLGTLTAVLVLPVLPSGKRCAWPSSWRPPRWRWSTPCSRIGASLTVSAMHFRLRAAFTTGSRWPPCWPSWRWPPSRLIPLRCAGRSSRFVPSLSRWRSAWSSV